MRSLHYLFFSLIGLLAGLNSWALIQSSFYVIDVIPEFNIPTGRHIFLSNYFFEGAMVGLGLGIVLQVRTSLWYHHSLVLILSKMFYGALFGIVTGLFSFALGYFMQNLQIETWLCRISSWTFLGILFVISTEIFRLHSGFLWPRIIFGGIGGFFGGCIFELLLLYQISGPNHFFGLLFIGFSISLFIGINENRATSCVLKVLNGPQEDHKFLLDQNKFFLGYGSKNDFILNGYAEVYNRHAILWKNKKEVIISNYDQDREVLINYRAIDHQQTIKKGDIIKVGTALLQYYEI